MTILDLSLSFASLHNNFMLYVQFWFQIRVR